MIRTFTRSDWETLVSNYSSNEITEFLSDQQHKLFTVRKTIDDNYNRGNTDAYHELPFILSDMISKNMLIFIINAIKFSYDRSIQMSAISFLDSIFQQTDAIAYELNDKSEHAEKDFNAYRALINLKSMDWIDLLNQHSILVDRVSDVEFVLFRCEGAYMSRALDEDANTTGLNKGTMIALYQNIDIFIHNNRSTIADEFNAPYAMNYQLLSYAIDMNKGTDALVEIEDYGIHEAFLLWIETQYDVRKFIEMREGKIAEKFSKK